MMLLILLSVAVISLTGVMQPGVMFAMTVAKSYRSPWVGVQIALGHAVIEIPLMLLIYFGLARFFESDPVQIGLSLFGGAMIIWLGISMFRLRAQVTVMGKDLPYNAFVAGILTSALNPFFILWWATIGSMLIMKIIDFGIVGLVSLMAVHWLCDLVWLSLVSVFVNKTQSLWGRGFQQGLFITCSLLLLGFGGWFVISGLQRMI